MTITTQIYHDMVVFWSKKFKIHKNKVYAIKIIKLYYILKFLTATAKTTFIDPRNY